MNLSGQAVLTVALQDQPLLGSLTDGQLRGALGTMGALHDFLAQLVVAQGSGVLGQSFGHIHLFHFAPIGSPRGRRAGGSAEPQGLGIQFQPSRWWRRGVAKLEAQLEGGLLRGRTGDEQVAVTHGMQGTRATSMSPETYSWLSNLPDYVE